MMTTTATSNLNTVSFDSLEAAYPTKQMGAAASALKGSLGSHEMVHNELQQMLREITPHLGQNIDVSA
jgi:hypothetical protein